MDNIIKKKKVHYDVTAPLRRYLKFHGRTIKTIQYEDLLRYNNSIPLLDSDGKDTLWETVFYSQSDVRDIHERLKKVYADIQAHGNITVIDHLYIDRIDVCPFGNSVPFRIRIVNNVNDNFDYFYVKKADASRIYGLELEHLLSPNKINFLVDQDTLIEEHIAGIPGDRFIKEYLLDPKSNKIRIAKEFVKFNERCFVRLLGDMHSSNFVVDITPDFEEIHYRIRAIDFDQQCYEGKLKVYLPHFFKQNSAFVFEGQKVMTPESMYQYQLEERSLIRSRIITGEHHIEGLLECMKKDILSKDEQVIQLREELAEHLKDDRYLKCTRMGELVELNLKKIFEETDQKPSGSK